MPKSLPVLPSRALESAARECPLLENDKKKWTACCTRRFLPLARRIAGSNAAAQDALQESWIRVLQHVGEYRGEPPACAWVGAIVRNCARDTHLGHATKPLGEAAFIADPQPSPESQAQQAQLLRLLREVVAALPEVYRQVVETRLLEEHSTAETAVLLGISQSNVSTRLQRACRLIRKRLDKRIVERPTG